MKEKKTSMKLPYLSPAINVISLHDRLATICTSPTTGDVDPYRNEIDNW